jgi:predicted nucleotidyltransferase
MKDDLIKKIEQYLLNKVSFAYLFGSIVTDDFRDESDIDVGVYLLDNALETYNLKSELEDLTDRSVDVIKLDVNDPIISMQVIANGKLLFANDQKKVISFKANLYTRYIDFKISRRELESNLSKGIKKHV